MSVPVSSAAAVRAAGSPSPMARRLSSPGWFDGRLVLGMLLVLGSVLVGAKVISGADHSQQVWVATRDLAPGTVLMASDLELGQVRLFNTSQLYVAGEKPVGYLLGRPVAQAELLPVGALAAPGQLDERRDVTLPVATGHLPPDLARGEQVDLYVTPEAKAGQRASSTATGSVTGTATTATTGTAYAGGPRLVLRALTVARVPTRTGLSSGSQDQPVVLTVAAADVLTLVEAMGSGRLDLVRVPHAHVEALTSPIQAP